MHSNLSEDQIPAEAIRDKIIEFRDGLPGFPTSRKFVMAQRPEEKPFVWMHSVSDPGLAFALVDAYAWTKDFMLEVDDAELQELGSLDPMDYASRRARARGLGHEAAGVHRHRRRLAGKGGSPLPAALNLLSLTDARSQPQGRRGHQTGRRH